MQCAAPEVRARPAQQTENERQGSHSFRGQRAVHGAFSGLPPCRAILPRQLIPRSGCQQRLHFPAGFKETTQGGTFCPGYVFLGKGIVQVDHLEALEFLVGLVYCYRTGVVMDVLGIHIVVDIICLLLLALVGARIRCR